MCQIGLRWVLGLLVVAGLSGCGQTGPLYMPKDEPVKTSQTPTTETAPQTSTTTPSK